MSIPKAVWVVAVASGLAAASPADTSDATRRVPQFENESVRVWPSAAGR